MFNIKGVFFWTLGILEFQAACATFHFSHLKLSQSRARRSTEIAAAEKESIVNKHNELRRKEGSSNMVKMEWNDYLASMATKWAEGCVFDHGFPEDMIAKAPYQGIGQNMFLSQSTVTDQTSSQAVQTWYNEKSDYNFDTATCAQGKKCGHYTQVVWAASKSVGCGYHVCPVVKPHGWTDAYLLVCNYGPAGNYVGEHPYKKGGACSSCPQTAKFCDNGLCSATEPKDSGARGGFTASMKWTVLLSVLSSALYCLI